VRLPAAAVVAPALAAALVVGAAAAPLVLLFAVLLVQGLVVGGWHRSLAVPGALGGGLVAAAACVAADLLVLAEDDAERPLESVPPVLGLAVLGALVHQLSRRDGRVSVNASMSATVTVAAFAGLACSYLAVEAGQGGAPLVAAAAVPAGLVAAGATVRSRLHAPRWADTAIVGVGALGALVVAALSDLDLSTGLAVGAGSAVAAWTATVLVARTRGQDPGLAAALPLALAGPIAYVLGRLLIG
jgi:hypothetical protein